MLALAVEIQVPTFGKRECKYIGNVSNTRRTLKPQFHLLQVSSQLLFQLEIVSMLSYVTAGHMRTLRLGLSSWLRRTVRSLVDRVSSALVFCLFLNKNAMLRGVPARRGDSPERGEGGGLWAPDSCYLDGENMQTVLDLLCPQGDLMATVVAAVSRDCLLSRCYYDGAKSSQRPNVAAAALRREGTKVKPCIS